MAKILEFKRPKQKVKEAEIHPAVEDLDDEISAIMNDYSLTPANRRWLLENMLMDINDKLDEYKLELERAERKLEALVLTGEKDIEAAYNEYIACVTNMTYSVKNLTKKSFKARN